MPMYICDHAITALHPSGAFRLDQDRDIHHIRIDLLLPDLPGTYIAALFSNHNIETLAVYCKPRMCADCYNNCFVLCVRTGMTYALLPVP